MNPAVSSRALPRGALALLLALAAFPLPAFSQDGPSPIPAGGWPFPEVPPAAGAKTWDTPEAVGLYNRHVGVMVRKKDLAVMGIWSAEGWSLVDNRPLIVGALTPLWTLEFEAPGAAKPNAVSSASAKLHRFAFETAEGGRSLVIRSEGVPAGPSPEAVCAVTARVSLGDDAPELRWSAEVSAPPQGIRAWSLLYPQFVVRAGDEGEKKNRFILPYRRGVLGAYGKGSVKSSSEMPYPGPAVKFQFTAAYGESSGRGFYLAAEDARGSSKDFVFRNQPNHDCMVMGIRHQPPGRGGAGGGYAMPYAVVSRPYRGDWWHAARLYREWWTKQPWAPAKLLQDRADVPDWLKKAPAIVRFSTSQPERTVESNLKNALRLRELLGRGFVGTWYAYQDPGPDRWNLDNSGHGNLLPPKRGVVEALKALKAKDVRLMGYVQSVIYNSGLDAADTAAAEKATGRNRDGSRQLYGKDEHCWAMCRASPWWQERLVKVAEQAVGEIGFDGIYLDSFGKGGGECFSPNHGHPAGGGDTVTQGQVRMGTRVRQAIKKLNPDAFMSGEAPNENYKAILDVDLYAVNIFNGYIPIYRVVWGDYNMVHGRVIRYSKAKDNMAPELASMFLDGAVMGRIFCDGENSVFPDPDGHPDDFAFFKKLVAYTDVALVHLRFGECLRPLDIEVPPMSFTESVENNAVTVPSVMNRVLRSHRDGSVAIVLVNVGTQPQKVEVPVDPALRGGGSRGGPAGAELSRVDENGRRTRLRVGVSSWKETVELGPREVCLLVLR